MAYRVARVPGDSRRLVLHPVRGPGTYLIVGLGVAATAIGGLLALQAAIAGGVVALASSVFGGWIGTEAFVTRVELERDEREGRLVVRWVAVGKGRELFIALEDLRDVVVEGTRAGLTRLALRLHTGERIGLTPYSSAATAQDENAAQVNAFLRPS